MRHKSTRFCLIAAAFQTLGLAIVSPAAGQMVVQSVPFQNFGSSFYENNGVQFGLRGPGFQLNLGNQVVPPFGAFDPNAGGRAGIGFSRGGVTGNLGLNLNQGGSRSISSTTASLTTTPGYPGFISSQTLRPFVTGVTPVVGGQVLMPTAAQQMAVDQQTQQAAIQQRAAANLEARQQKANESFERGLRAEESGNLRMARANYRNALQTAQGDLRQQIIQRMRTRGW